MPPPPPLTSSFVACHCQTCHLPSVDLVACPPPPPHALVPSSTTCCLHDAPPPLLPRCPDAGHCETLMSALALRCPLEGPPNRPSFFGQSCHGKTTTTTAPCPPTPHPVLTSASSSSTTSDDYDVRILIQRKRTVTIVVYSDPAKGIPRHQRPVSSHTTRHTEPCFGMHVVPPLGRGTPPR